MVKPHLTEKSRLVRFVRHPATNLFVGVALILSGIGETIEDLRGGFDGGFAFAVHHGMVVFGLFKVLSTVADVIEGLERSVRHFDASRE
jgi:hypothetical protein